MYMHKVQSNHVNWVALPNVFDIHDIQWMMHLVIMDHPQSLVDDHVSWFSNPPQQLLSAKGSKDNPVILPQLAVLTLVVQLSPVLGEPLHLHLLTKQRQKVFKRCTALLWRCTHSEWGRRKGGRERWEVRGGGIEKKRMLKVGGEERGIFNVTSPHTDSCGTHKTRHLKQGGKLCLCVCLHNGLTNDYTTSFGKIPSEISVLHLYSYPQHRKYKHKYYVVKRRAMWGKLEWLIWTSHHSFLTGS